MTGFLSRRDFLQLVAATAVLPVSQAGAAPRRRSVGIVGGGMAGVSLAWLLDGAYDVTLLEARESIGGNVRSVDVALDGHEFVVDMGAQYFHPGPYPLYTALLEQLGLFDPNAVEQSAAHGFPASITLTAGVNATPRFVSPILPDRWWPFVAPWNWAGLWAFGVGFLAAKAREELNAELGRHAGAVAPDVGAAAGAVGRDAAAVGRVAVLGRRRAMPGPVGSRRDGLRREGAASQPARSARVLRAQTGVDRSADADDRSVLDVDRPDRRAGERREAHGTGLQAAVRRRTGPSSSTSWSARRPGPRRVSSSGDFPRRRRNAASSTAWSSTTRGSSSTPIPCTHRATRIDRSFLNCDVHDAFCEASMWMASVISGPPPETAAKLWKSWTTHRAQPAQVLYDTEFRHMLPRRPRCAPRTA